MSSEQNRVFATAHHEAGHAVAAIELGFQFDHVTIVPNEDDNSLGHILYGFYSMFLNIGHRQFARDLRDYLITNRAGPVAQERYTGQWDEDGASSDDEHFWQILWQMYGERRERHARNLTRQARRLVYVQWPAIERVTQGLLREHTLSYSDVKKMLDG